MNRLILPFLMFLATLLVGMLQPPDVSLRLETPSEVVAGNEFEVQVFLNKGDLESFSRFQMDVPAGLTVTPVNTSTADFSFSDKKVRMIWLRLPSREEVMFSYKVMVDERLKGTFSVDGILSYIFENERKSVSSDPKFITILPSPSVDPGLIVDISEFEKKVIQVLPSTGSENVACLRQKPGINSSGNEYIVTLLVNKEDKKKFAKIEETIPPNYTAVAIDAKDGIFTFKNNTAKFLWMNLPAESQFSVSYRLIPVNGSALTEPDIKGKFSFLANEKTIVTDISQVDKDLQALSQQEVIQLIAENRGKPSVKTDLYADNRTIEGTKIVTGEKKVTPVDNRSRNKTNRSYRNRTAGYSAYLLEPDTGVYYRIQLAAGHKNIDIKRYFNKFHLDMDVKKEEHEGWLKYSVGSFKEYKDARDYRVHIWNTTPIGDAFVSAYNNGTRITVQEALMIADQRWHQ